MLFRSEAVHLPENRGVSHARNEGIRRARGAFVTFVDPDDYVESTLLARLYEALSESGAELSVCGVKRVNPPKYAVEVPEKPPYVCSGEDLFFSMLRHETYLTMMAKLYRAEDIKDISFDEGIHCGEDVLYLYRLLRKVRKVSLIPDRLYSYICHPDSATQGSLLERRYTESEVYEFLCQEAVSAFPQMLPYLKRSVVDINVRLAVKAVACGDIQGRALHSYLKRFQQNVRRYSSREVLAQFPHKKITAEIILLYISSELFWAVTALYKGLKRARS